MRTIPFNADHTVQINDKFYSFKEDRLPTKEVVKIAFPHATDRNPYLIQVVWNDEGMPPAPATHTGSVLHLRKGMTVHVAIFPETPFPYQEEVKDKLIGELFKENDTLITALEQIADWDPTDNNCDAANGMQEVARKVLQDSLMEEDLPCPRR